jgi:hypothetical protein
VLLGLFKKQIENTLEINPTLDDNMKVEFRKLCDQISDLAGRYGKAAELMKDFPGSQV